MNRHSLLDDDVTTPNMEHSDIFGDEYEVDDFDMVADGFRPDNDRTMAEGAAGMRRLDDQGEEGGDRRGDVAIHTISAHYSSRPVTPTAPSRNSVRKSRDLSHQPNPFASPEDENHEGVGGGLQFEPDAFGIRRSFSTTSSHMYARTNSPRFGASGPSHPYGMYQQGIIPRSPSVATASTVRPLDRRSSTLARGPQHPYSMYPQGVDEDLYDEDEDEQQPLQHNPIPVGFPGLAQSYVRRLGPDGEEQDIMGEDGHMEQLPPYSRYPDEGPEKMPLLMPTALHSRVPVAGTDPTMPLMHTLLQPSPTPQSMTDVSQIPNRHNSVGSMERLRSKPDDDALQSMSRNWKAAPWREKARIKFCGIPFWCYVLALIIISSIATVLGIVIGGFVANHGRNSKGYSTGAPTVTFTTSLFDASLIASPTSQAPSTGTFALSLGAPQQTQAQCLPQTEQQIAWNCGIVPNAEIAIVVNAGTGSAQGGANIFYAADIQIGYGAQASYMNTTVSPFITVKDMDDVSAGPAFFFSAQYDKVVVLPEFAIDDTTKQFNPNFSSQGWFERSLWDKENRVARPSEKPWFCVWNNTFLEGFIYVSHDSNWTGTPTSHYIPVTPTPVNPMSEIPPMTTTSAPSTSSTAAVTQSYSPTTAWQSETTSTSTSTSMSAMNSGWNNEHDSDDDDDDDGVRRHRYQGNYKRQGGNAAPTNPQVQWSSLPVYPYLVKLEERRLPTNSITPYCQQYQILDNGQANWLSDPVGQPIIVPLNEQDPGFGAYESAGIGEVAQRIRLQENGVTVPNGCHCQWISGGMMPGQPMSSS